MVFPGVLRGHPGPRLATIHTSRPRRSLSSPWMLPLHCSRGPIRPRSTLDPHRTDSTRFHRVLDTSRTVPTLRRRTAGRRTWIRKRRGPGPLEEPFPSSPEAFRFGWRGLTPQWPRSLRLGSASSSKVARSPADCNPLATYSPHVAKKAFLTVSRALETVVRQRLSGLPQ